MHTFVAGDPAVSFSRKTGIAKGPNAGAALRQDLPVIKTLDSSLASGLAHWSAVLRSSVVIPYGSLGGGRNVIGK